MRFKKNGTPNHILVNKILEYDLSHFVSYAYYIKTEMTCRGYQTIDSVWDKIKSLKENYFLIPMDKLYSNWHNDRYLKQCYYNLEEKYDCGGIPKAFFIKIKKEINM